MRKILLAVVASALLSGPVAAYAASQPQVHSEPIDINIVEDFAHLVPASQQRALEREVAAFAAQSNIEMAVVSVPTLHGRSIDVYSHGLFRVWSEGREDPGSGVLFLVAPNERQIHIETGSRLESMLTDEDIAFIMRNRLQNDLSRNDFGGVMVAGTHIIINHLANGLAAERATRADASAVSPDSNQLSVPWQVVDAIFKAVMASLIVGVLLILGWPASRQEQSHDPKPRPQVRPVRPEKMTINPIHSRRVRITLW